MTGRILAASSGAVRRDSQGSAEIQREIRRSRAAASARLAPSAGVGAHRRTGNRPNRDGRPGRHADDQTAPCHRHASPSLCRRLQLAPERRVRPPAHRPHRAAPPSPTAVGAIDHPTGATDVVLRIEEGGGFVPIDFPASQAPVFTLYGDGLIVFQPIVETFPEPDANGITKQIPWRTGPARRGPDPGAPRRSRSARAASGPPATPTSTAASPTRRTRSSRSTPAG